MTIEKHFDFIYNSKQRIRISRNRIILSSEFNNPLTTNDLTINFIYVPEYPNLNNEDLEGNVTGIALDDYRVAVYIRVDELWWTKPHYASPLTTINLDGIWTCDITTGGNDCYATAVAAYLLPVEVEPPICGPCYELPEISEAVACVHEEAPIFPEQIVMNLIDYPITV